jgi:hypothetical protein
MAYGHGYFYGCPIDVALFSGQAVTGCTVAPSVVAVLSCGNVLFLVIKRCRIYRWYERLPFYRLGTV